MDKKNVVSVRGGWIPLGCTQKNLGTGTKEKGTYDRNLESTDKRERKWLEALKQ